MLVDVEVLVDVVVVGVVVVVVVIPVGVTTNCGPLGFCSRDLRSAPSEPVGFETTKAKVVLPSPCR